MKFDPNLEKDDRKLSHHNIFHYMNEHKHKQNISLNWTFFQSKNYDTNICNNEDTIRLSNE